MVDCGSAHTKVALLASIEGHYRLVARTQTPTTSMPPTPDLVVGVQNAIHALERITGRTLLREGRLITPEHEDGSGVDGLALATSAGGPLRLVAIGPGRESLIGLVHRSTGGLFVQIETLPPTAPPLPVPPDWRRTVSQVRAQHPHGVLVISPPFGTSRNLSTMEETARAVAQWLDVLREPAPDSGDEATAALPVLFTGSATDALPLQTALQGRSADLHVVEGLSPSTLAPLNRAASALYESAVLRTLPGYSGLRGLSNTPPAATITALAGMVRYLAQHFRTTVVGVDVGASSTTLAGATANGEFMPATDPNAGVGSGIGHILRARDAHHVLRWLSFAADEDELREYALTRMLRPHALPATARELEFEHAFAREALYLALRAPGARLAGLHPLDVVLGTGGVLTNVAHPAQAALILLDALQPRGITSLVLDTAHISNMLGSVAGLDSVAAAEVAESDAVLLQLGTVISPVGTVAAGEPALRVMLEFADGRRHIEDVAQGMLLRLPVAPGEHTLMGLQPAPNVDIGLGPGQQAQASEPVEGGALGLIIDARGRSLALAEDPATRIAQQQQWHRSLGLDA